MCIAEYQLCFFLFPIQKDRTALHLAAGQGHTDVIETLVEADIKIDFADKVPKFELRYILLSLP